MTARTARHIRVGGLVQGVGFRPFVWRLAHELGLTGWVRNDARGVEIFVEGAAAQVDALIVRLRREAPPLARVDALEVLESSPAGLRDFVIVDSLPGQVRTAVGHDTAPCADCLAEMCDPGNRRWRHAFICCTHCGPRYTVTQRLPYDRSQTSLAAFPLCAACAAEYADPGARRFHAETTCCPQCGPSLSLCDAVGRRDDGGDAIAVALDRLRAGAIVAVKGLGGFHLVCDARNAASVARLRDNKDRAAKPFALLTANAASAAMFAELSEVETAQLEAAERPIVLLKKRPGADVALPGIAPGLAWLGVMLPSTPLHYLLFHEAAGRPAGRDWLAAPQPLVLVCTSANAGGEPMLTDNDRAIAALSGVIAGADAFLLHDRAIVARCDDSVVRATPDGPRFIRRARGYVPRAMSLRLPRAGPSILATGGHFRNTVCITRGDEAFVSTHIGALDNAATCRALEEEVAHLLDILDVQPEVVAHDAHPDFFSSRFAVEFARRHCLPHVAVQHHHAHIAAVLAEHGVADDEPVIGLALDGVGLGSDGGAWGGELLRVDGASFERVGHLQPLLLPGGDRAALEPWRMAAAALHAIGRGDEIAARFRGQPAAATVAQMLARGINAAPTSSLGRAFDAAAGLLGVCTHNAYEGQAAMLLESLAEIHGGVDALLGSPEAACDMTADGLLDLRPLYRRLADCPDAAHGAALFHAALVTGLAEWAADAAHAAGVGIVACGGGCLLNRMLASRLAARLAQRGLRVLLAERMPPNDGGLSLGQAWVARLIMESRLERKGV